MKMEKTIPLKIWNHQHYTVDKYSCGLEFNYRPKRAYETKEEAEKVLKRFSDSRLNVYLCELCKKWHVGRGREIK